MNDQKQKIEKQLKVWAAKLDKAEIADNVEAINKSVDNIVRLEAQLDAFFV